MTSEVKERKHIFSKEINERIDGFSLGIAFSILGLLLLYKPDFFLNEKVGNIVRWLFIVTGVMGTLTEFGKLKFVSKSEGIKDIWAGCVLFAICVIFYYFEKNMISRIISFFFLMVGVYAFFHGLITYIYSTIQNKKNRTKYKEKTIIDILTLLTKISSLVLIVIQIIKEL